MASNDLKTWVSDKLMMLLGYSQAAVVNYLIAMGNLMFRFWIMELM
jgi:pre-mRNA-splicing factor ATP-dependent RNA helicase DHX16